MKNTTTTTTLLIAVALLAARPAGAQRQKPVPPEEADRQKREEATRVEEEVNRAREQGQIIKAQEKAQDKLIKAQDKAIQERVRAEQELMKAYRATAAARKPVATRKETVAFCGVGTSEVPAVLTQQLRLTPGMGLVVDFVDAGSPAEAAGVKQYDVLTKFNDQILCNPDQFRILVQIRQPSDDVKLTLIHQGETKAVNIELGQKEIDVEVGDAGGVPDPLRQQIHVGMTADGDLRVQPPLTVGFPRGGGATAVAVAGGKRIATWADDQQTMNLEQDGNRMLLSVTDRAGRDVFRGAVDTEEQRKLLPPTVAKKLTDLEAKLPTGFAGGRTSATRILTSNDNDTLLVVRFEKDKPSYMLAFSTADGKTVFDGPVKTDEQRKALPEALAKQLQTLEQNQANAAEFGVLGRPR
jgi:hypothetical protein